MFHSEVLTWPKETQRLMAKLPQKGIFLTGIEGSDPLVDGVRRNQLYEAHDFYTNYEARLERIHALGIRWLRFGAPYSQIHLAKDAYDFSFMDKVIKKCQDLGITVMADLLHFGLPDWMHEDNAAEPFFQNPNFPKEFAKFAYVFALRYPQITYFTPVNEPFVTAHFSAKLGLWNEHQSGTNWDDDRTFIKAAINISRAAILARKAIEHVWLIENRPGEPLFIQNESFEQAYALKGSGRQSEAKRFNLRRFVMLDLIFGYRDPEMWRYLRRQGVSLETYEWFMENGKDTRTILGIDHYPTCIHTYEKDRTIDHSPRDPYRLYEITKTYWDRYPLPLLHTEVNAWPEHAVQICLDTFNSLARLRQEGYPVIGMGWYGDDLQIGWHVAMKGPNSNEENPVGLFYKGEQQPVASRFQFLAKNGFEPLPHLKVLS